MVRVSAQAEAVRFHMHGSPTVRDQVSESCAAAKVAIARPRIAAALTCFTATSSGTTSPLYASHLWPACWCRFAAGAQLGGRRPPTLRRYPSRTQPAVGRWNALAGCSTGRRRFPSLSSAGSSRSTARRWPRSICPGLSARDLGTGTGSLARVLTERGHSVAGIDVAERLRRRAERRVPSARFRGMDLVDLVGLPSGSFDLVSAGYVLHGLSREDCCWRSPPPWGSPSLIPRGDGRSPPVGGEASPHG
jgi:hypothetical protein